MIYLAEFEKKFASRLPQLGSTRNINDPSIICKFYDEKSKDEWYIVEGEKRDQTYNFYGYIFSKQSRMGNFTFNELENKKTVMISFLFKPCPLSYIKVTDDIISPNGSTAVSPTLQEVSSASRD